MIIMISTTYTHQYIFYSFELYRTVTSIIPYEYGFCAYMFNSKLSNMSNIISKVFCTLNKMVSFHSVEVRIRNPSNSY